jgi:tRNA-dihydrouridine synthase
MVARGALGNPWIFRQISHFLETGEVLPPPDIRERMEAAMRHLHMTVAHKGERAAVLEMRKHLGWYIKGTAGAAGLRVRINKAESAGELEGLLGEAYSVCTD